MTFILFKLILVFSCFVSDPEVPFVTDNLVETANFNIPCRVTDPDSVVILRSLPSGHEIFSTYEPKQGFIGSFSNGDYICETIINGQAVLSIIYTVKPGKPEYMRKSFNYDS